LTICARSPPYIKVNVAFLTVSIVHDDAKLTSGCFVDFFEMNNARVIEQLQDFGFSQSSLLFIARHFLDVYFLNDSQTLA
jgi:hypothetical protein